MPAPVSRTVHYAVFTEPKGWAAAGSACLELGGSLASVRSYEENRQLHALLFDAGVGQGVWLGGSDRDVEGVYRWHGSGLSFSPSPNPDVAFAHWAW